MRITPYIESGLGRWRPAETMHSGRAAPFVHSYYSAGAHWGQESLATRMKQRLQCEHGCPLLTTLFLHGRMGLGLHHHHQPTRSIHLAHRVHSCTSGYVVAA